MLHLLGTVLLAAVSPLTYHLMFVPPPHPHTSQGYLSEAAACIVDHRLQLGVVPNTKIVKLASPVFNYGRMHKIRPKVGSFQVRTERRRDRNTEAGK
jgi:hypothetical protein